MLLTEIERHELSTGDIIKITKIDRQYQVVTIYRIDQCPDVIRNLSKRDAYTILEERMRDDVMEYDL